MIELSKKQKSVSTKMEGKTRKTLKNVLFGSLITLASILPINKTEAQTRNINHLNTLYLTVQPENLHAGFRNDFRIPRGEKKGNKLSKLGLYVSGSFGKYNFKEKDYSKEYIKLGTGTIFYPGKEFSEDLYPFISIGASYEFPKEESEKIRYSYIKGLEKISGDLCVGARINNFSFFIGMNTKTEAIMGVSISYDWANQRKIRKNNKILAEAYTKSQQSF